MGGQLQTEFVESEDKELVSNLYAQLIAEQVIEYGTTPYSGELCTLGAEINFTDKVFTTLEDAEHWITHNHHSPQKPLAVRLNRGWLIGGFCQY